MVYMAPGPVRICGTFAVVGKIYNAAVELLLCKISVNPNLNELIIVNSYTNHVVTDYSFVLLLFVFTYTYVLKYNPLV